MGKIFTKIHEKFIFTDNYNVHKYCILIYGRNRILIRNIFCSRYSIYWKLFTVMGIPYLMELACFLYARELRKSLWYLSDIVRCIQGLFVFILFVLKDEVINLLYQKFCPSPVPTISWIIAPMDGYKGGFQDKIVQK